MLTPGEYIYSPDPMIEELTIEAYGSTVLTDEPEDQPYYEDDSDGYTLALDFNHHDAHVQDWLSIVTPF